MADIQKISMDLAWATNGDKVKPDDAKIQAGWGVETIPRQTINWITNRQDNNIQYMLQKGFAEWDPKTEYIATKSYVQYAGSVYRAVATSTGITPGTDATNWVLAFPEATNAMIALKGVTPAADRLAYFTGTTTASVTALTSFARSLLDDTSASVARATLGAAVSGSNDDITGFTKAITAPTPDVSSNSTTVATTAFVVSLLANYGVGATQARIVTDFNAVSISGFYRADGSNTLNTPFGAAVPQTLLHIAYNGTGHFQMAAMLTSATDISPNLAWRMCAGGVWSAWQTVAGLKSPVFTGSPAAPTVAADNSSTLIATTAHVQSKLNLYGNGGVTAQRAGADLNTLVTQGNYYVLNPTNAPVGTSGGGDGNGYVQVYSSSASNYTMQMYTSGAASGSNIWFRRQVNGTWAAWAQIPQTDSPTFNQAVTVDNTANNASARVNIRSKAGQYALTSYGTGSAARFEMGTDNTAEGGNNAGSNFYLNAFADDGTYLFTPFSVNRATGTANMLVLNVSGTLTAPTAASGTSSTVVATTAFVQAVRSALQTNIDAKAPLASPALTGTPTAPTASAGTNTTQLATTAFVSSAISTAALTFTPVQQGGGIGQNAGSANKIYIGWTSGSLLKATVDTTDLGNFWLSSNFDPTTKADLASPNFTGTLGFNGAIFNFNPTGSSNAALELGGTRGTATTPYIDFHSGATAVDYDFRIIANNGTGAAGGGNLTMLGALLNLTGVGSVTSTTPSTGDSSTRVATTAFVQNQLTAFRSNPTFLQTLTLDNTANASETTMTIKGQTGQNRKIAFQSSSSTRFEIGVSSDAESSNAGSNFFIRRYNDSGTLLNTPLSIDRFSGTTILTLLNVSGSTTLSALSAGATTLGATTVTSPSTNDKSTRAATTSWVYGQFVGTVAQSSGTPTGAIIERGSNSNGEYVRYADGTQICWNTGTISLAASGASTSFNLLFAASFTGTPAVQITAVGGQSGQRRGGAESLASNGVSGFFFNDYSSAVTVTINLIATGRWF